MMSFELFIGDGTVGTVGKCPWFAKQKKEKKTNITGSNHLHTIRRTLKTVSENMRLEFLAI